MAYELRPLRRYKARYNSDNSDNLMRFAVVRDGEPHAVVDGTNDTATVNTFEPDGTAIDTATAMTIATGESVITVAIDTSSDTSAYATGTGFRGDVTYTEDATGDVYKGHIIFDVAPYLLHLPVTFDQLQDLDPRIKGMSWAGDDDFSGILEACRDEYQLALEAIADEYGLLVETMIIDANKAAVPFRRYVLAEIFSVKDSENEEAKTHHEKRYNKSWDLWVRQLKPDKGQEGTESSAELRTIRVRSYT